MNAVSPPVPGGTGKAQRTIDAWDDTALKLPSLCQNCAPTMAESVGDDAGRILAPPSPHLRLRGWSLRACGLRVGRLLPGLQIVQYRQSPLPPRSPD